MPDTWFFFVLLGGHEGCSDAYFAIAKEHAGVVFHLPCVKANSLENALSTLQKNWGIVSTSTPVPLGSVCYKWQERNPEMVGASPAKREEGEVYHLPTYRFKDPRPKGLPRGSFFSVLNPPQVPPYDMPWVEKAVLLDYPFHCEVPMFYREPNS